MKIKKGDTVQVLKGKDKGKTGIVAAVFPKKNSVLVDGINQYKRHKKGQLQNQKSEIVTITKPLSAASVVLIDPTTKKPTKIGYSFVQGKKVRMAKKSGQQL